MNEELYVAVFIGGGERDGYIYGPFNSLELADEWATKIGGAWDIRTLRVPTTTQV